MNRREFVTGAALAGLFAGCRSADWAVAAAHPSAGSAWRGWKPGEFQVHFIYTGVGESQFMIFPDGTTMLLDCGDFAAHARGALALPILPSMKCHAGEWIARYVRRVNPCDNYVDYMMLSHFHSDHGGCNGWHAGMTDGRSPNYFLSGFAQAAEWLHFGTAIDRGWPDYNDPVPLADDFDQGVLGNMKALYSHLQKRDGLKIEKFRLGASDQIVQKRIGKGHHAGFKAFNFAANGRICSPADGTVRDLYAPYIATKPKKLDENALSLGNLFSYGPFTYYTAGDFSSWYQLPDGTGCSFEEELAKFMPRVEVAKINHHGYESMEPGLVKALDARCYVACVWDQYHCLPVTMERIEGNATREHLYFPGMVPTKYIVDGKRLPWMAKAVEPSWEGMHTVLTVPRGGDRYTMTCLSAADESMTVKAEFEFKTEV